MLLDTPELAPLASPLQKSSLREVLRAETNEIHQSLHCNPGLHQLVSGQNSIDLYHQVLKVFYQFYRTTEGTFDFVAPQLRFPHEAKPLQWLAKDFAAQNLDEGAQPYVTQSPSDYDLPLRLETYLGYLYVKQGSTLGGQGISKQLKKSLRLDPGETQFFFHGFGESTGIYWKEFLQFISQLEPGLDNDLVVTAAQHYFQMLDAAFKQHFPLEE